MHSLLFIMKTFIFQICINWSKVECKHSISYLLLLTTLQVSPLLHWLAQINTVHGNLYLTNHVMLGETIKVKNLQHQGLSAQLCIRDLEREVIKHWDVQQVKVDSLLFTCNKTYQSRQ